MNGKNSCGVKKKSGISAEYWSLITDILGTTSRAGYAEYMSIPGEARWIHTVEPKLPLGHSIRAGYAGYVKKNTKGRRGIAGYRQHN